MYIIHGQQILKNLHHWSWRFAKFDSNRIQNGEEVGAVGFLECCKSRNQHHQFDNNLIPYTTIYNGVILVHHLMVVQWKFDLDTIFAPQKCLKVIIEISHKTLSRRRLFDKFWILIEVAICWIKINTTNMSLTQLILRLQS